MPSLQNRSFTLKRRRWGKLDIFSTINDPLGLQGLREGDLRWAVNVNDHIYIDENEKENLSIKDSVLFIQGQTLFIRSGIRLDLHHPHPSHCISDYKAQHKWDKDQWIYLS